jgi:hypothetical protein
MSRKRRRCPMEEKVLNDLKAGILEPEAKAHSDGCPVCRQTILVHQWMNRLQEVSVEGDMADRRLPAAEAIWEGAFAAVDTSEAKELERKAMRPLAIFQALSVAVIIAALVLLLFPRLPAIGQFLDSHLGSSIVLHTLLNMIKSVFLSLSFMLLPLGLGLSSMIVYMLITAFKPRRN